MTSFDQEVQEQIGVLSELIESSPEDTEMLLEILVSLGYVRVEMRNGLPLIVLTDEIKEMLKEELNDIDDHGDQDKGGDTVDA